MHTLQHSDRSNSSGSAQSNDWDFESSFNSAIYKEQIKKANSVPIIFIMRAYGIKLDQNTKHIVCPFAKRHKNGQDSTPSFNIYINTNSFWCFGCKTGASCVDFVSNMDNIGTGKAAEKILSIYNGNIDLLEINNNLDFSQRLQLLMEFSNYIREMMQSSNNINTFKYLEEVCQALDNLNMKYKKNIDNDALLFILDKLRKKVEQHIKCQ